MAFVELFPGSLRANDAIAAACLEEPDVAQAKLEGPPPRPDVMPEDKLRESKALASVAPELTSGDKAEDQLRALARVGLGIGDMAFLPTSGGSVAA